MRGFGALAALLVFLPATATADDIYVSVSRGKKANPGTKESPLKNLAQVLEAAKAGDRIFVAEGLYDGKSDSGVMPRCAVSKLLIQGGWKDDFSERDPFKYLTIIAPPADKQGTGEPAFDFQEKNNNLTDVTIDGFVIDRGGQNYYFGDRMKPTEPTVQGHQDNTSWGLHELNLKKSPGVPTISLVGNGSFAVRNCILVNNAYIGIYVKCGGSGETVVENNLILVSVARGIECIMGGGWGDPTIRIRNNTVLFTHTIKSTEGHALAVDQYAKYAIENNVLAFSDGAGINSKFAPKKDRFAVHRNLFFYSKWSDYAVGGNPAAKVENFEDELSFPAEGNEKKLPGAVKAIVSAWFDLYCQQTSEVHMVTEHVTWDQLNEARKAHGLEPASDLKALKSWRQTKMIRYPNPLKKGESISWAEAILKFVGADGPAGIQPLKK